MVIRSFSRRRVCLSHRIFSLTTAVIFAFSPIIQPVAVFAQGTSASVLNLPAPGSMVPMSESFTPLYVKGITIDPNDPLKFSFIVNSGDTGLQGEELKVESQKLIKYFLAALTVPEEDLWVNLSPYDRSNIIPERFGYTEMGRDLLAQDYILKQITASVMYPEGKTGSAFWSRVQQKVKEKFGAEDIPVNMFNKIWIVPDKAEVYEINGSAYVVDSHLKVMLEEDYFALKNDANRSTAVGDHDAQAVGAVSSDVVREVLLPEIEKEVNEGKNFANLRQIYNANILATWYKMSLKDSLLGQVYIDKNKVSGVDIEDKSDKLKIYEQYVDAFKKGAYELVKKDYDPATQQVISRKYFAGGVVLGSRPVVEEGLLKTPTFSKLELPQQQKFERRVANTTGDDFILKVDLSMSDKPVVPVISSSPLKTTFSQDLASFPVVLSQDQKTVARVEQNIAGTFSNLLGSPVSSSTIKNKTKDFLDVVRIFPGSLSSPEKLEHALVTYKNWSPQEAKIIGDNAVELARTVISSSPLIEPVEIKVNGQGRIVRIDRATMDVGQAEKLVAQLPEATRTQVSGIEISAMPMTTPVAITPEGVLLVNRETYAVPTVLGNQTTVPQLSRTEVAQIVREEIAQVRPPVTIVVLEINGQKQNVGLGSADINQAGATRLMGQLPEAMRTQVKSVEIASMHSSMPAVITPEGALIVNRDTYEAPEAIAGPGAVRRMSRGDAANITQRQIEHQGSLVVEPVEIKVNGQGRIVRIDRATMDVGQAEKLVAQLPEATRTQVSGIEISAMPMTTPVAITPEGVLLVNRETYATPTVIGRQATVPQLSRAEVAEIAQSQISQPSSLVIEPVEIKVNGQGRIVRIDRATMDVGQAEKLVAQLPEATRTQVSGIEISAMPMTTPVAITPEGVLLVNRETYAVPTVLGNQTTVPQLSRTEVAQIARQEIALAGRSTVDINVASAVGVIKSNIQESSNNMMAALRSNSDVHIQQAASLIASIVVDVMDKSDLAMNRDTLTQAVRARMEARRMDPQLIAEATRPKVIDTMITAALSPVDVNIASMPTKMSVDPRGSRQSIIESINNMPELKIPEQDIPQVAQKVAQAMQDIAPGSFSTLGALRTELVNKGVPDSIANEFVKQQNIGEVARAMSVKIDSSTAVLPTSIGIDLQRSRESIRFQFSKTRIGSEATRLSEQLVEMATSSPGLLSSRETMKKGLIDRKISEGSASFAVSDEGLRLITLATRNTARETKVEDLGGIDINPAFLKLLVKRDGKGVPVPVGNVNLKDTDIYGFEPVISKVEQVDNLPAFIGIEEGSGTAATVRNFQ